MINGAADGWGQSAMKATEEEVHDKCTYESDVYDIINELEEAISFEGNNEMHIAKLCNWLGKKTHNNWDNRETLTNFDGAALMLAGCKKFKYSGESWRQFCLAMPGVCFKNCINRGTVREDKGLDVMVNQLIIAADLSVDELPENQSQDTRGAQPCELGDAGDAPPNG